MAFGSYDDDPYQDEYGPVAQATGAGGQQPIPVYSQKNAAPPVDPGAPVDDRGTGGGGGGGFAGLNFNFPGAPTFKYTPFAAPSFDDARNDPGYQLRLQSGQEALERSAAARGVLRTGGTLKDIVNYGQNFATQEYSNVFDRALRAHQARYTGERDAFAPTLADYNNRFRAEQARALAEFELANRTRGGGGGRDPRDEALEELERQEPQDPYGTRW
jgi:hypothetical protein